MRKVSEFKGYRSITEYDPLSGRFFTTPFPEIDNAPGAEQSDPPLAGIVPFPQPAPYSEAPERLGRMAG